MSSNKHCTTKPKSKSKSISNLPLPLHQLHRFTPSHTPSPSSKPKPRMTTSRSTSSISRTVSKRTPLHSPSPLPSTDTLSYFPPFESMGSDDTPTSPPEPEQPIAGPSRPRHTRGRSLGSLAGLMSVCLSTISPSTSMTFPSPTMAADDEAVQALTRRCGKGKRRVLEPLTVNEELGQGELAHKRRVRSDLEPLRASIQARRGGEEGRSDGMTSSRRKPRMTLQVPPSGIPSWCFPLPSPPIASLSPDIPNDAFHRLIDNPLASRESSPVKRSQILPHTLTDDMSPTKSHSSGSSSSSPSSSPPCTPQHRSTEKRIRVQRASTSPSIRTYSSPTRPRAGVEEEEEDLGYLRLQRSVSGMSNDSKRTIRPGSGARGGEEGEITPKADKGYIGEGLLRY